MKIVQYQLPVLCSCSYSTKVLHCYDYIIVQCGHGYGTVFAVLPGCILMEKGGAVGKAEDRRSTSCLALFNEVRKEVHHLQVILAAAAPPTQEVTPALSLDHFLLAEHAGTLEGGTESVYKRQIGQCREAALQVQQVGAASPN